MQGMQKAKSKLCNYLKKSWCLLSCLILSICRSANAFQILLHGTAKKDPFLKLKWDNGVKLQMEFFHKLPLMKRKDFWRAPQLSGVRTGGEGRAETGLGKVPWLKAGSSEGRSRWGSSIPQRETLAGGRRKLCDTGGGERLSELPTIVSLRLRVRGLWQGKKLARVRGGSGAGRTLTFKQLRIFAGSVGRVDNSWIEHSGFSISFGVSKTEPGSICLGSRVCLSWYLLAWADQADEALSEAVSGEVGGAVQSLCLVWIYAIAAVLRDHPAGHVSRTCVQTWFASHSTKRKSGLIQLLGFRTLMLVSHRVSLASWFHVESWMFWCGFISNQRRLLLKWGRYWTTRALVKNNTTC